MRVTTFTNLPAVIVNLSAKEINFLEFILLFATLCRKSWCILVVYSQKSLCSVQLGESRHHSSSSITISTLTDQSRKSVADRGTFVGFAMVHDTHSRHNSIESF